MNPFITVFFVPWGLWCTVNSTCVVRMKDRKRSSYRQDMFKVHIIGYRLCVCWQQWSSLMM